MLGTPVDRLWILYATIRFEMILIFCQRRPSEKMKKLYNTHIRKKEFYHLSREAADHFVVLSIISL